ncbi:hypothetical protein B0H13DRAFT_2415391 [Mycena leptocephala]|nr:hypothetical protein B0H13DRAFT_2415391 [Mycena leptocephala]
MSASGSNAIPNKKKGGTTTQPLKSSSSRSDWLSHCIHIAKILKEAADLVPEQLSSCWRQWRFADRPSQEYMVNVLQQKVKQNREDLRELCENTMRIAVYLGEQLASHQNTTAIKLKDTCEELESELQGVIAVITKLQGSRGLGGQVKEFFMARSITDKITGYQRSIQTKCETLKLTSIVDIDFKVTEIQTAIADMRTQKYSSTWFSDFTSVQASQSTSNCPPPSRNFLGRQIILDKMHQYFNQDLGEQQIYVLYGLGGAGKTQISLKFIAESSHTTETIDMGLKSIATTRKIGDSSQDTLKWLAAKTEPWLLFFDNADDPTINLNKFLPKCNHGNIVITSRNPGLRGYGQHTQVSDMDETEAIELLLKCASQDTSLANEQIAVEIVKAELQKPLEFLSYLLMPTGEWDPLSFLKLTNEIKAYSLISFDPVKKVFSIHPLVHAWGRTIMANPELYHSIMGAILGMAISEILELDIQLASLRLLPHVESVLGVNRAFSPDFRTEYAMVFYRAGKHTEAENLQMAVLEKQKQIRGDDHSETLRAMNELALTYQNLREFKKAEQLQVVVLEKRKQLLGDDHPETLIAMGNLAVTYWGLKEFKKAEELQVVVLEKRKQLLGDDHPDTLLSMGNLAVTYGELQEFKKAEELEVVVLEKQKQLLGDDHPDTLWAMGNLATTYWQLKEFTKAEELEVVVLDKRKQLLGDHHPDTLRAMENLASTYRSLNKTKKAEELEKLVKNHK